MASKRTILVVEDEEPILLAIQRILELTGEYEALIAQNGEQASEIIKSNIPDLIISDISMPKMDGLEFCKKIRANPLTKSIPFVFLTAKKEKMIEGISAGGDDFLMKPFNVDEILVKIEAIFRRVAQSKEQASQHKGKIEDIGVESILELCLKEKINGELVLQSDGRVGVVRLKNGDIYNVALDNFSDDEALDNLLSWEKGTFVIRPVDLKIRVDENTQQGALNDWFSKQEVFENIWWVGFYDKSTHEIYNTWLRKFSNNNKTIQMIINPGSLQHFSEISSKIGDIIGDISKVNIYLTTEHLPENSLNIIFFRKANSKSICMTSKTMWEQLKHMEINPRSVKFIEPENNQKIKLATGNKLRFVKIPFCPSADSFMVYDIDNQFLFTGALFSQENSTSEQPKSLYAGENDWEGMRRFHQHLMPQNSFIVQALKAIKKLDPPPKFILPARGKIIPANLFSFFFDRLNYLVSGNYAQNELQANISYVNALNNLIAQIQGMIPLDESLKIINQDAQLSAAIGVNNRRINVISADGEEVYKRFVRVLIRNRDDVTANQIKSAALKTAYSFGVNIPEVT